MIKELEYIENLAADIMDRVKYLKERVEVLEN